MRSTVYDRMQRTGLMTSSERPLANQVGRAQTAASSLAKSTGLPAAAAAVPNSRDPEVPVETFPPSSDDEPLPEDAAEPDAVHHGTPENPVDFVDGKLIIRSDSGELFELKSLAQSKNSPKNGF